MKHKDADTSSGKRWITLENGEHVLINSNGEVKAGAGGGVSGKRFIQAKSKPVCSNKKSKAAEWYDAIINFDLNASESTVDSRKNKLSELVERAIPKFPIGETIYSQFGDYTATKTAYDTWTLKKNGYTYEVSDYSISMRFGEVVENIFETREYVESIMNQETKDSLNKICHIISSVATNEELKSFSTSTKSSKGQNEDPPNYKEELKSSYGVTEYKNPYVSNKEREKFRKKFHDIYERLQNDLNWTNMNAAEDAAVKIGQFIFDEIKKRFDIRAKRNALINGMDFGERITCFDLYNVLQDIRKFGLNSEKTFFQLSSNPNERYISQKRLLHVSKNALSIFPTDWANEYLSKYGTPTISVQSSETLVPYVDPGEDTIYISTRIGDKYIDDYEMVSHIVHEFSHLLEGGGALDDGIYGILKNDIHFLRRRTMNQQEIQDTNSGSKIIVIPDKFFDSYLGRIYKDNPATEILSVSMQLLGYSADIVQAFNYTPEGDNLTLPYILGLLTTFGRKDNDMRYSGRKTMAEKYDSKKKYKIDVQTVIDFKERRRKRNAQKSMSQ